MSHRIVASNVSLLSHSGTAQSAIVPVSPITLLYRCICNWYSKGLKPCSPYKQKRDTIRLCIKENKSVKHKNNRAGIGLAPRMSQQLGTHVISEMTAGLRI
ncbi:hypothetical protein H4582DRAFT_2061151 [Lactarius indigo]|nr:hypothetical protein H4582DRAFT_2061151 [Lactarius indigo]